MAVQTISDTATDQARQVGETAKTQTGAVVSHAADAASGVAETAKQQLGSVAENAASEGRQLADQAQRQVSAEAERQTSSLASNVRDLAQELHRMAGAGTQDSALQALLSAIAGKGEGLASLLDEQGPDGLLREAQAYGRRRPGAFLASALAAGFATARLARHASKATDSASDPYPRGDGQR